MLTFATPAAYDDYDPDAERHHGPPSDRCHLHSPAGNELLITDSELEEFERDTHTPLVDDSPDARTWQRLIRWLIKNVGLFDVTRNIEIRRQERLRSEPEYFI